MKKLMNHSQLREQENSPKGANNAIELWILKRHRVQKGDSENTEGIKIKLEGIKSGYEH